MRSLERTYFALNVAIFWGFAAAFLAAPDAFASHIGIALRDTTARADFRAMYGGLSLGVGVLFALALTRPRFREAALVMGITTAGGLAIGRIWTLATAGAAGIYIHGSLASELLSVAMGLFLLRGAGPSTVTTTA